MVSGVAFAASNNTAAGPGAYSTGTPMPAQEQIKLDQQRKEDIAKRYSVYDQFGLTYDQEQDCFYYDGQPVRFFADEAAGSIINSFTRANGTVDLRAVRNAQNELAGIVPATQEEYAQRTASIERAQATQGEAHSGSTTAVATGPGEGHSGAAGGASNPANNSKTSAFSETDSNYVDHSLNAYLHYGVSYDQAGRQWMFNNKPIHFLSDGDNETFVDNSTDAISNGVSLKVVRKADGKIDKLVPITAQEAAAFFGQ